MKFVTWPPQQHCWLYLSDVLFQQGDGQPFVVYQDGEIDTRQEADGFLNQVARYGKANNMPPETYSEETLSKIILDHLPLSARDKYCPPATPADINFSIESTLHPVPVPASLMLSAGFNDVLALSRQSIGQWIGLLDKWKKDYPEDAKHKKLAGPVWWWAAHSISLNYTDPAMSPEQFVVYWVSLFPCQQCRITFETQWLQSNPVPKDWEDFKFWISQAHDFVTSHKES